MPLTWREVAAPNFSASNELLRYAAGSMNGAFDGLTKAIAGFQNGRTDAVSGQAMMAALGQTDPNANPAQALAGLDPRYINKAAFDFAAGRQNQILSGRQTEAQIGLVGANTANTIAEGKRQSATWDLSQSRLAAQPEANAKLAEIRTLANSGDPAKIAQSRQMMQDITPILTKAGVDGSGILGVIDNNQAAASRGLQFGQDLAANDDYFKNRDIRDQTLAKINELRLNSTSADQAIRAITNDKTIDPRIAKAVIGEFQSNGGAYFSKPDPYQSAADQLSRAAGIPVSGGVEAGPLQNADGTPRQYKDNSLRGLVDQHEGAANYDTLFGHAQDKGGALGGVRVSGMTIGQLKNFSSGSGVYGQAQKAKLGYLATPMGRYQIVGSTLEKTANALGLSDDTVFDAATQDKMFDYLVNQRIGGPRTMAGKIEGLRNEWEGFKNVSNAQLESAINAWEKGDRGALGSIARNSGAPLQTPQANLNPTGLGAPLYKDNTLEMLANAGKTDLTSLLNLDKTGTRNTIDPTVEGADLQGDNEVSIKTKDGYVTLPRDVDGKKLTLQEATDKYNNGELDPIGTFETKEQAQASLTTSKAQQSPVLDPLVPTARATGPSEGPTVTAAQRLAEQVLAANDAKTIQPMTAADVANASALAQAGRDTATIDNIFNPDSSLVNAIIDQPYKNKSQPEVVQMLKAGPLGFMDDSKIDAAITEIRRRTGVPAETAAIFAQEQTSTGAPTSDNAGLLERIFNAPSRTINGPSEPYGSINPDGQTSRRIDVDKIEQNIRNLRGDKKDKDGNWITGNYAEGVAKLQNQRASQNAPKMLEQSQQLLATYEAQEQVEIQNARTEEQKDAIRTKYALLKQQVVDAINATGRSGNLTLFGRMTSKQ